MVQEIKFSVVVDLIDAIRAASSVLKKKKMRIFLDWLSKGHQNEYFDVLRLILPQIDKERANYDLQEKNLAKVLTSALGLSENPTITQKLDTWRTAGKSAGVNAGNFPMVAVEVLQNRQKENSSGITIREVNNFLDRLAAGEGREEKAKIFKELLDKTNVQEMKWILSIILKDLGLGMSEKIILREFHPDAEDLFNVTCDLKGVCQKLINRNQRYKRQDIEPGKAVRPQLASRVASPSEAWKKMRGKDIVVETKFDGDRIQLHKNGTDIHFFSRNFIDHTEFLSGMLPIIMENVLADKCILDGEMTTWEKGKKQFGDFGTNQHAAKAARDGTESDLELCYVAFDILYFLDTSVIHLPLREREEILRKAVKPVKGRLEIVHPKPNFAENGERLWTKRVWSEKEVEDFFLEAVKNRDEGIMIKDLNSNWNPGDRSSKWLKLKPDYVNTISDLDAIIIGGYYGAGQRGGLIRQYLLGIAEKPKDGGYPTCFISFCRVGNGLSEEEAAHLFCKLEPYIRKNEKGSRPPSFYKVAKERPDVWLMEPEKSVILQVKSDIRTIQSIKFGASYALRFPRIEKIRFDKPWYDCLDDQTLAQIVSEGGGRAYGKLEENDKKKKRERERERKSSKGERGPLLLPHMRVTDVTDVREKDKIFEELVFFFVNFPKEYSRDTLHKMAIEHGGNFSMNFSPEVTSVIAFEKKGYTYVGAEKQGDVLNLKWFLDSVENEVLLPLKPKHYLHLSPGTKNKFKDFMDEYGDPYYEDIDVDDLKKIFNGMDARSIEVDADVITHYKTKYIPAGKWGLFKNCKIFVSPPIHSDDEDSRAVAKITLDRLSIIAESYGGEILKEMRQDVTHAIFYSLPENPLPFKHILKNFPSWENNLRSEKIHVLSHKWLEETTKKMTKFSENDCELRSPSDIQIFEILEGEENFPTVFSVEKTAPKNKKGNKIKLPGLFSEMEDSKKKISGQKLSGKKVSGESEKFLKKGSQKVSGKRKISKIPQLGKPRKVRRRENGTKLLVFGGGGGDLEVEKRGLYESEEGGKEGGIEEEVFFGRFGGSERGTGMETGTGTGSETGSETGRETGSETETEMEGYGKEVKKRKFQKDMGKRREILSQSVGRERKRGGGRGFLSEKLVSEGEREEEEGRERQRMGETSRGEKKRQLELGAVSVEGGGGKEGEVEREGKRERGDTVESSDKEGGGEDVFDSLLDSFFSKPISETRKNIHFFPPSETQNTTDSEQMFSSDGKEMEKGNEKREGNEIREGIEKEEKKVSTVFCRNRLTKNRTDFWEGQSVGEFLTEEEDKKSLQKREEKENDNFGKELKEMDKMEKDSGGKNQQTAQKKKVSCRDLMKKWLK